jgi:hypothetical protein
MQIESVTVIPMSKESKFEDIENDFEVVGITTDYATWFGTMVLESSSEPDHANLTKECIIFARKQQSFMTSPIAMFGDRVYTSFSTRRYDSLKHVNIQGPLYRIYSIQVEDETKDKIEGQYMDDKDFKMKNGLVYPKKNMYVIRYGKINA